MKTALAVTLVVLLIATGSAAGEPAKGRDPGQAPAVVVELFTSQGCSSCPPADRLLARLADEGRVDGIEVIPLAFHVDYWNYIGWTDPFSSADWSQRQRAYATALGLDTIYTPQMFFNGRRQIVGADEREMRRAVRDAAAVATTIRLELSIESGPEPGALTVRAAASRAVSPGTRRLVGLLAVFQDDLVTPVGRGENARKTLENERVVRGLHPLFELEDDEARVRDATVELMLDPQWSTEDIGLALLVQDPVTLAIHAATALRLDDTR